MGRLARFIRFFTEEDDGNGEDWTGLTSVKGTSPLTLLNAIKYKLKSLIQYGKVSVSGSDVTCNNGVLSAGVLGKNLCPLASGTDLNSDNCYTLSSSWAYDITGLDTTKDYTFSLYVADEYASATSHRIYAQGDTSGYISTSQGVGTFSRTLKPDENGVITIAHNKAALNTTEYAEGLQKFMLNEGESALSYEPYQYGIKTTGTPEAITLTDADSNTQTATAPNLYAVEDITDEVDIITGKVTHRTQAVISDGTTPSGRYVGTVGEGNILIEALEEKKTGTLVSFTEEKARKLNGVIAEFSPVQDLHGQSSPYPAGGGKQMIPYPYVDGTTTKNGVTFTPNADGSVVLSGGSGSGTTYYTFYGSSGTPIPNWMEDGENYYIQGYEANKYFVQVIYYGDTPFTKHNGTFVAPNKADYTGFAIVLGIYANTSFSTPLTIYPMLSKGTTAKTFAPYSNICPISGWTGVDVYDDPKYGGSIEWNQLVENGDFSQGSSEWQAINATAEVADGVATITVNVASTRYLRNDCGGITSVVGHKYLSIFEAKKVSGNPNATARVGGQNTTTTALTEEWQEISSILTATGAYAEWNIMITLGADNGSVLQVRKARCFDLTAMFGAGNEPATVEAFKALFPKDYYPYNAGELSCVSKVNGDPYTEVPIVFGALSANLFDKSKAVNGKWLNVNTGAEENSTSTYNLSDWIPVKAGVTYTSTDTQSSRNWLYDTNKTPLERIQTRTFTPSADGFYRTTVANSAGVSIDTVMVVVGSSVPQTYVPYNDTIFGGYLRINRGGSVDLVGTWVKDTLNGTQDIAVTNWRPATGTSAWLYSSSIFDTVKSDDEGYVISDKLKSLSYANTGGIYYGYVGVATLSAVPYSIAVRVPVEGLNTSALINAYIVDNPIDICYELATPVIYHLPSIDALFTYDGVNNWWQSANGNLTLYIAEDEVIEDITPQPLRTSEGTNTVSWTAEVSGKEMEAEYRAGE